MSGRLLDVTYRPVQGATTWHPEVRVYEVIGGPSFGERGGQSLGPDLPRPASARGQVQARRAVHPHLRQAGRRLPEGALVCNFPRPGGLMEHGDVVTLFHEFGHLVHHVLGGHTRWAADSRGRAPSGTSSRRPRRCSRSGRGTPSVLAGLRHATPRAAADPGGPWWRRCGPPTSSARAVDVRQQMFYAATSLHLHDRDPARAGPHGVAGRDPGALWPVPLRSRDAHASLRFGHLNGYRAVYYTYMWSLVIAKDLFTAFEPRGLFDPETAGALPPHRPRAGRAEARGRPGGGLPRPALRLRRLRRLARPGCRRASEPASRLGARALCAALKAARPRGQCLQCSRSHVPHPRHPDAPRSARRSRIARARGSASLGNRVPRGRLPRARLPRRRRRRSRSSSTAGRPGATPVSRCSPSFSPTPGSRRRRTQWCGSRWKRSRRRTARWWRSFPPTACRPS